MSWKQKSFVRIETVGCFGGGDHTQLSPVNWVNFCKRLKVVERTRDDGPRFVVAFILRLVGTRVRQPPALLLRRFFQQGAGTGNKAETEISED